MGNTLLFIGGLALVGFGYYCYRCRRLKLQESGFKKEMIDGLLTDIEAEKIDTLSLTDVVNYFKGAHLKKGVDIPFIAVVDKDTPFKDIMKKDGAKSYLLACYNEETEEVTNYRLLTPNSIDEKLQEVLGNEKFVVLS